MHVMEGKHASIHYSSQAVHKVQEGQDALHKCISTKYIYNGNRYCMCLKLFGLVRMRASEY